MKIRFLGAARTVTGSCFVVETGGCRFAVDCGMHQGNAEIERRNWDVDLYEPDKIDFFILTHAHIDHSGLLPRMMHKGFHGRIYAAPPTVDLLKIMLLDSAHIQEMEAQWKSKKRLRYGGQVIEPLYTQRDAELVMPLFKAISYDEPFEPVRGLRINLKDAGHILGAALIEIWASENGTTTKLVFSGDVGRPAQLMINDPSIIETADFLFMESTYGDRDHKNEDASLDELAQAVDYSYSRGEKILIPAFAVERTQEMIYSLHLLWKNGRLPQDLPVYVDSPLAIKATDIFRKYTSYFDEDAKALMRKGENPLELPQLHFTESTEASMAINVLKGPAVVISASGMADAGRIKHHLRHNLWREGASVVFVGFQAQGTIGRKIVDGAKTVRLFNEDIAVKAKVYTINGFSAHAGQSQLLDWVSHFASPRMQVFLVHGEYATQQILADLIRQRFGLPVHIPDYLEETTLITGETPPQVEHPERAAPGIEWDALLVDLEMEIARLRSSQNAMSAKPWVEQTEVRERLIEVKRDLSKILA